MQFRPSYSLTLNLVARGKGSFTVAQQLVSKSFANWRVDDQSTNSSIDVADKFYELDKSSLKLKKEPKQLDIFSPEISSGNKAWTDMLALTRVLITYGCIIPFIQHSDGKVGEYSDEDLENGLFEITPAGVDVGMLNFENSLWIFVALGGTFDIDNVSSNFDDSISRLLDDVMDFHSTHHNNGKSETNVRNMAQKEAELLASHLQNFTPAEIAGYVSCLIASDIGKNNDISPIYVLSRLTRRLQQAIQYLSYVTDRYVFLQNKFCVDKKMIYCPYDLSFCEVVMAWADGCSWNEALTIAGVSPGDLTRIIIRAYIAVRQLGQLKFHATRKDGFAADPLSSGLHPEIRKKCREAAKSMNRYPVKDPLPFEVKLEKLSNEFYDGEDNNDDDNKNNNRSV